MARLPIDNNESVIVLHVLFEGERDKKMLKMVLDTGATLSTIPTEIALAVGCDPSKPVKRVEMITAGGVEYVPVVIVPKITFLGFKLKNVETACLNLPPQSAVSGLLGLNVLKNFDIFLKFSKNILEILK